MKFKSLFRRGQQNHGSHQKQHRGQRHSQTHHHHQQQMLQQQVNSAQTSSSEIGARRSSSEATVTWVSSSASGNTSGGTKAKVGMTQADYIAKMHELERECESLKMERTRLEASYRNAVNLAEARRFEDRDVEIAHLKVRK